VTFGIDMRVRSALDGFSPDGKLLAWGNADGTVSVCDLGEANRRLREVGLAWER
jgi:hypothetical protein